MAKVTLAVPSDLPGGLEAKLNMHFGHCEIYTLIYLEDGVIKNVSTLPSIPHKEGSCITAVSHLAENGVTALLAGGMGMRPLMASQQAGIAVYRAADMFLVGDAVKAFMAGNLPEFTTDFTCKGHH